MIVNLFLIIISIWCVYVIIKKCITIRKEEKDETAKAIYDIFIATAIFPFVLYVMDTYNIPTRLVFVDNVDTQNWLNFFGTYTSGIMATLISVAFLVFVTREQLIKTFEDNQKLNAENFKIQNLPFLKYAFTYKSISESQLMVLKSKSKDYMPLEFNFEIKNIGLNAIKKTFFEVEGTCLKKNYRSELTGVSCIEKNESKYISFCIDSISDGKIELEMRFFYQDLFKNWYEQKVKLFLEVYNIHDKNNRLYKNSINVYDEKQITNIPKWIEKETK